jgi:hypothetical protein
VTTPRSGYTLRHIAVSHDRKLRRHRDVDYFIEKLESTIKFFTDLESPPSGDVAEDFVPFI